MDSSCHLATGFPSAPPGLQHRAEMHRGKGWTWEERTGAKNRVALVQCDQMLAEAYFLQTLLLTVPLDEEGWHGGS